MDEMEMEHDGKKRWSDLPMLVLWVILDRLHYVDRERLGFVCKDWKLARQSYRPPPPCVSISPWVIHRPATNPHNIFTIFNPFTTESFTLGVGPLNGAQPILFSRKGWLLFQGRGKDLFPVILYNLPTGATITLPSPHIKYLQNKKALSPYLVPGDVASFSTYDDGTPRTVAFAFAYGAANSFYIGDVLTRTWSTHNVGGSRVTTDLLVVGNKLYALDEDGLLIIFDILTHKRTLVAADHYDYPLYVSVRGLAQSENGEVFKIEPSDMCSALFHISKLNATQTGWEQILPHHQQSVFNSWYLSRCGNHFVATNRHEEEEEAAASGGGVGIKVYDLNIPIGRDDSDSNATIIVHDFKTSTQSPITDSPQPLRPRWFQIKWIDLGLMHNVPPSCLRYHPGTQ